ncbi:MAG: L-threonine 3-dehydrogenase [Myxococcales bacterium]|nr:L-threonine 3-dehydrogenase [Myxococcales bacterium]MCB9644818.1 L-threonine 3-dehydrogenase [Myxococcales bacterium]
MSKILVTGALGQIGSELTRTLRKLHGEDQVIATDVRQPDLSTHPHNGPFETLDVMDEQQVHQLIEKHQPKQIYHLAALLSAVAERNPQRAWDLNINGSLHIFEAARIHQVERIFVPSSIAAFGPSTPLDHTPQDTIQRPNTMYGITKVATELLGEYYYKRFGLDCRGVRLPGVISYTTPPGGGTTDYAVEMFHYAVRNEPYTCYLRPETSLDMMYMEDTLRACVEIMEADSSKLKHRNAFNITAMQFTPAQLAAAIQKHIPSFVCNYEPDPMRQAIADSWPNSMDDSAARQEWGWKHEYDLPRMVEIMLNALQK